MDYILSITPFILSGFKTTLWVFAITALFSIPLGVIVCLLRLSKIKIIQFIIQGYILVMRGTPLLLQIIFVFFGLPIIGVVLNREIAVSIAFILNYAAYFAEIFRGGVNSIDIGQFEASEVLKLSKKTTYLGIIIPQVFKVVIPSLSNELITLVKDTSLVYVLGLGDILRAAKTLSNKDASLIPIFLAGGIYLIFIGVLTYVLRNIENKFEYYR
ncbi:amino acid ABC transporter permease [Tissierella sp. P1]|jgi:polar amino acid transport system permease protein|uniref:amino acid ABC transporter permease n=1 Tax=Tissierella TaxID=41273 RepID=UPI000BA061E1|nr:amino acid ABC transporter permease [Tissierella sp. P1]MDU5083031.1 amino acid ABC transporter permease [Bacillota bacterium]OZV11725.1 amino acid ABC transporter permease [Tissierella sp. P1]